MVQKKVVESFIEIILERAVFFGLVLFVTWSIGGAAEVRASTSDGTIDSTYRYAWGENIGWVDFGSTTDAVHITDSLVTGSVYGENVGWIVLDPEGYGGVTNDAEGNLSGYAWGENIGWVDFSQVVIGADGVFTGQAYSENVGWVTFGTTTNKVMTDWRPILGSTTIANHDDTQVNNAFTFQNVTNGALFAFKLTPESGNATVTDLVITISGAKKISTSNFSNIRLYRDHDSDAQYDATDSQVGGAGTMNLSGQAGTITFSGDFLATTTQNYLVVANWNAPQNGSFLKLTLKQSDLDMVGDDGRHHIYGVVSSIQHHRNNKGGGGGTAAIGTPAPEGDGDVSGGTEEGGGQVGSDPVPGELIGDDPTYKWPTAHSGEWTNGAYAYDRTNSTYATTGTTNASSTFLNHGFSIPATNQITGIEVKLELSGTTAAGSVSIQLSYDGGTSWTTTKTTNTLTTSDVVATLGGPSDNWGRTWSPANFTNANFAVRIIGNPSSNTIQVDAIQVKVYHQATGGGSGGGGAI